MPTNEFNPSSCTNFHLEGYEVTIDNFDMKISDFEIKNQPPPHQPYNMPVGVDQTLKLYPITIRIKENFNVAGDIYIKGTEFGFTLYKVRDFSMKYDLMTYDSTNSVYEKLYGMEDFMDTGDNSSILTKSTENQDQNGCYANCRIDFQKPNGFVSIKGKITFKIVLFEEIPNGPFETEFETWPCLFSEEAIENLKNEENFVFNCKAESIHFNKTLLCTVSDVFRTMIQGRIGQEAKTGMVEIDDFTPDTIKAFKRICFDNKDFEEGDSVPDLLLFAQKYFMNSLKQKCLNYLVTNLSPDNIYDVTKIADQIDDENLLKICARYMSLNKRKLEKNEEWMTFLKSHPNCMFKIMQFMLYAE